MSGIAAGLRPFAPDPVHAVWDVEVNGAQPLASHMGPGSTVQPHGSSPRSPWYMYLAWFFSEQKAGPGQNAFQRGRYSAFCLMTGIFCLLILVQPDFGGAAFPLADCLFLMCLVGGTRLRLFVDGDDHGRNIAPVAMLIVQSPYRSSADCFAFLDPFKDAHGRGIPTGAVAVRLWLGPGFEGQWVWAPASRNSFFLPEAHNDFHYGRGGRRVGIRGRFTGHPSAHGACSCWRSFLVALQQDELQNRLHRLRR